MRGRWIPRVNNARGTRREEKEKKKERKANNSGCPGDMKFFPLELHFREEKKTT
jgi:hypothetical protein